MAVTPDDIAVALGRTTPTLLSTEYAQWEMWIGDALMLIEDRLGNPAELDQAKLSYVVREAVVAQVRRPDDATSVSVSVDDASTARTYRTSTGRVAIRDEWWNLLSPVSKSGAFTIETFPGGGTGHLPWCSAMFGATYCSCGYDIAERPIFENAPGL